MPTYYSNYKPLVRVTSPRRLSSQIWLYKLLFRLYSLISWVLSIVFRWPLQWRVARRLDEWAGQLIVRTSWAASQSRVCFETCLGSLSCCSRMTDCGGPSGCSARCSMVGNKQHSKMSVSCCEFILPMTFCMPPTPSHVIRPQIIIEPPPNFITLIRASGHNFFGSFTRA